MNKPITILTKLKQQESLCFSLSKKRYDSKNDIYLINTILKKLFDGLKRLKIDSNWKVGYQRMFSPPGMRVVHKFNDCDEVSIVIGRVLKYNCELTYDVPKILGEPEYSKTFIFFEKELEDNE